MDEKAYAVWLHDRRVGSLHQKGDYTRFSFADRYLDDYDRPVLGLAFEQNLTKPVRATLRLPPWFSNLLPEGTLREWVAMDRGVSSHREMELLAQVGHDLPGAVRVTELPVAGSSEDVLAPEPPAQYDPSYRGSELRFSLAGVALKFSMLVKGQRLALPARGAGGDWIVKLPDRRYDNVPHNEFAMMSLAGLAGIEVPEVRLVHRDQIDGIASERWHESETHAYAVRRFDRTTQRGLVHIEDLAQVRELYPDAKYFGNYETIASLIYRRRDRASLREFARRLTFIALIGNGDAHLKNWSIIYRDLRVPSLAPAYDLVATAPYVDREETLGLKFAGSTRFDTMRIRAFNLLEKKLGATEAELADVARAVIDSVNEHWPAVSELLRVNPYLRQSIGRSISERSETLLR